MRSFPVQLIHRAKARKDKCHICQCEYETTDKILTLPCKHFFHPDCIKGWFKENRTCPVCRFEVEK
ncbi:hypothetical protein GUITHDRAFT_79449 [Guillardia theta CCMP2712]|uniref:RING-type domain-containing protein n=1 Tax=Guillardia theta (strain CCMP2712) TaxID=905079 RepID=L1IHW7_GUITC|nr:hypothetical protein GUITHDRAFT_79449 [Guillardia theta CCMP2712]EKX35806.1 hypothetical protein GUITHDRAFT_79449 [Guillardia theta CCMP2712]|eukprot:XP_005822786.1 hypothetical protein GUITHDRAFT_79449 [Guillardia theta CCMP2712]